ncbi:GNAT family N-acetyltransferase [Paenibacillus sp. F411]|uniref:GCN5-like N-acetyltransferase n=1 Tax=Paenibacillus algicola TaxID=2565926 RepID=A0A4P8XN05_9BACL|nr:MULTISPECIES: GNAT family N-acetyltransferase [Paenibacillus]MBO2945510.1 GNAT family N-acetyltransferase [Paenibacillus sp. F411]QCT04226.1 GCN5-like N-acetyltransferase [Paenibacillus algicola]
MEIEALQLGDEDTVQQIWSLQHAAYPYEAQAIGLSDLPPLRDTYASIAACGEIFYGIRDPEGDLIGAVAVELEQEKLTISRMMVAPDHFREGIATRLVTHVLSTYKEVPLLIVFTGSKNFPAVRLYEKAGFQPVGTLEVVPAVELTEFHLHRSGEGMADKA